jgi:transposase
MKIKDAVGIDMSKLTFDATIHSSQVDREFDNDKKDYKKLIDWTYKNSDLPKENIIFVFEHTGLYSHGLSVYLASKNIPFLLVPGLEIKKSMGMVRGKSDKADARMIAKYGYRMRDEITPTVLSCEEEQSIKHLLSLRQRLVKQRAGFKASLKEQKRVLVKNQNKTLLSTQVKMISYLTKQIKEVEKEMMDVLKSNQSMLNNYKLITSIKGIGKQTALFMIAYTANFTKFKNHRKFASYSGIAPFQKQSGTSIRGKTKVSNLANKKIKSLLDLCAKSSIQHNPEMKQYYEKRVANGKNKMSTINVIRNKLVSRMFAVVNRNQPYVDTMKYAA